jgi:hemolysin activation/secretion protein
MLKGEASLTLITSLNRMKQSLAVAISTIMLTAGALTVQAEGAAVAPPQADLNALRSIFGIDAPNSAGDVSDAYAERQKKDDLAPKLNGEIPDAAKRDAGPRIIVNQFVFDDLREYPEIGITKKSVEQEAERLRADYMKEEKRIAGGFTIDESAEVIEYLSEIGRQGDADNLTYEDMQNLVEIVRQQNRNRGLSYADLEEVTNKLTLFYRQKGLFLTRVQLPAQNIKDGIVRLSILEGRLGQVEAINNKKYTLKTLSSPFEPVMDKAVSGTRIEESLYVLNDLPGLNITGAFTAGENPGETKLKLNVRDEEALRFLVRLDNHGSAFTGDTRLFTSMEWYNPIGFGDSLKVGYLRSEDIEGKNVADNESRANLGQFSYSFPFFSLRTRVTLSADYNSYSIVDEDGGVINALELEGTSSNYALNIDHKIKRSRDFNMSTGFTLTDKETKIDSEFIPAGDHSVGGEFNFYIDGLNRSGLRMLNVANLTLQYGEHKNEVAEGRDDTFTKFGIDTNSLFFVPLPFSEEYSRLITTIKMQYSSASLPSFEQFSMGGANGVRAFRVGKFSADTSAYIANEWYFDLPRWSFIGNRTFGEVFQAGLLLDFAYGVQNGGFTTDSGGLADDEWARMSAAGIVIKAVWGNTFSSKITIATPIEGKSSLDPEGDSSVEKLNEKPDTVEVFADINFVF